MRKIFLFTLLALTANAFAQTNQASGPGSFGEITSVTVIPSLAKQLEQGTYKYEVPRDPRVEMNPKMRGANKNVPGKGFPKAGDPLVELQKGATRSTGRTPSLVFDSNPNATSTPSDPTGVVGPNHYLAAWNTSFRIFDKDGNALVPAASLGTVLTGNTLGDPIVLYDKWADRFVITEFANSPNGFEIAVCSGPDPVNDDWYVYQGQFTTGAFPDYTKFSIWSDGYYVTANVNNGATGDRVWAVEREPMLSGDPTQYVGFPLTGITTSGFYSPQAFNVTGGDLPAAGSATIVYLQDDAWGGVSEDHLKLWTINADWDNPGASTISAATEITTADFTSVFDGGSFANLPQPGAGSPDIDALQATVMNQAQFRKFPTHNSAVFNFVVDTDAGASELAGIRWFELRQDADGEPWSIYQEGTYVSPVEGRHAFSGSMAMDENGNIGMGYSTVSDDDRIAIQYTGRYANDPLNTMTVEETLIKQSTSNSPSTRFADYVHLTVDPVDEKTFWHVAEYFRTVVNQARRANVVGVFKLAPDLPNDVGVISIDAPVNGVLGNAEQVVVTVRNFGINEQSDIPVSYTVNGGTPVAGVVPGPIASGENFQYTFTATSDLSTVGESYEICATTALTTDEDNSNDGICATVSNLEPNDIGVTAITAPTTADNLGDAEVVTVTINNFGGAGQSNFEVTYTINGGAPVTETVTDLVAGDSQYSFTFAQTANLNELGDYVIVATTSLPGDADTSNDSFTTTVTKSLCQPGADCSLGDGLRLFNVTTIDNSSDCDGEGYADFTDQIAVLNQDQDFDLTVTTEYGNQYLTVWIDFNDDFVFTNGEKVVNDYIIGEGQAEGTFTETTEMEIPADATLGQHLMRAKTNWNAEVPNDVCEETQFGETEDYTADIMPASGLDENLLGEGNLQINTLGDEQYFIQFETSVVSEPLMFTVHNTQGQKVVANWITPVNGVYQYDLDMSYAATGAYLIRLGNQQSGKVAKIIVR